TSEGSLNENQIDRYRRVRRLEGTDAGRAVRPRDGHLRAERGGQDDADAVRAGRAVWLYAGAAEAIFAASAWRQAGRADAGGQRVWLVHAAPDGECQRSDRQYGAD